MKVRGERECKGCGTRWSYYETRSIVCPECGSVQSVGLDDRTEHTAGASELDLTDVRGLVDEASLDDLADQAESTCAEYVRKAGFIEAGSLRRLDDVYLAAQELRHVAPEIRRSMRVSDEEERYFLALLAGADDGDRPDPAEVPESLHGARGLAAAASVDAYRSDVRRYLREHPDRTATQLLGTLGEHQKRVEALDGEVSPRTAAKLVRVARDIGRALTDGDERSLIQATERLDELTVSV